MKSFLKQDEKYAQSSNSISSLCEVSSQQTSELWDFSTFQKLVNKIIFSEITSKPRSTKDKPSPGAIFHAPFFLLHPINHSMTNAHNQRQTLQLTECCKGG